MMSRHDQTAFKWKRYPQHHHRSRAIKRQHRKPQKTAVYKSPLLQGYIRRFKDPSEKAIYIEETQPLIPGVFVHKLSILCCIFLRGVTHESRAFALYCLLTQAIRSLMALEKQMSACAAACFSFGLIISYSLPLHYPIDQFLLLF